LNPQANAAAVYNLSRRYNGQHFRGALYGFMATY
jgi:hypothetical protein